MLIFQGTDHYTMIKTVASKAFLVDTAYLYWTKYVTMLTNSLEKPSFSLEKIFLVGSF